MPYVSQNQNNIRSKERKETSRYPYKGSSWFFFELGLAQSREDPPGLIKFLGLLKIGPLKGLFKLFEFSRQKYFKI